MDTLGYAKTDKSGKYEMQIKASERGIYPLIISRRGQTVAVGEMVVANNDTATMDVQLPTTNNILHIRSVENGAWAALKNARLQHKQSMLESIRAGKSEVKDLRGLILMTANMLWNLDVTFAPQTNYHA